MARVPLPACILVRLEHEELRAVCFLHHVGQRVDMVFEVDAVLCNDTQRLVTTSTAVRVAYLGSRGNV